MLTMLWVALSHAFKEDDDPQLTEYGVAYTSAMLRLQACWTLALKDGLAPGPSAEAPGSSPAGATMAPAGPRTGTA